MGPEGFQRAIGKPFGRPKAETLRGGICACGRTRGLCGRPLDPFAAQSLSDCCWVKHQKKACPPLTESHSGKTHRTKNPGGASHGLRRGFLVSAYFAYSVARVSRITFTRIWPGYSISFSMRLAISLASTRVPSSVTSSGLTMMRTSRPDWIA